MLIKPPPRLRKLPLNTLAPNILTICALCSGLTAIRFAIAGQWKFAVAAIAVAALFDMLDGRVARLLKGASRFGAELDSLSDFLCFGVAPVMVLYFWTLHDLGNGNPGWLVVLAFATCTALRLARFNTALEDTEKPVWTGSFFTGIPSPAGAGLSLLFMILSLEVDSALFRSPFLNAIWALGIGFLMISKVPTYSFKRVRVKREAVLPVLLGVGVLAALLMNEPWYTLAALEIAYIISIPFSLRAHERFKRGDAETAAASAPAEAPGVPQTDAAAAPAAKDDEPPARQLH
ncbi:phosphatidylcholine/phosphatidylserine synthase [Ferrovibrio sp. MS7]|uniref:CDP-alcohol phosphatidyltransferase family protein n=1 Tax=Ferrovibrio plantarum TaxID=3119164 RepID=UPI003136CC72